MRSEAAGGQTNRPRNRPSGAGDPGAATPEALAAALYSVLSGLHEVRVSGHPAMHGYAQTVVEGRFDLNEVSRKVLALLR